MGDRNRIGLTEQEVLNFGLDNELINPPTSIRGQLTYADGGGWLRVPVANIYASAQMDWTSGNLDYYGVNASKSAVDGSTDWVIFKFTYDVNDNMTKIQSKVGTWTGRGTGW